VASSVGVLSHPIDADAFLATTFASLERGEPHRAALSLHEATLRVNANRRGQLQWICHLARALVQEAEAQRSESAATINLPRHDIEVAPPPIVSQGILALRIRQLRLNGDLEYARRLGTGISEATSPVLFEIAATALLAGRSDEARKCLEGMYIDAEPTTPIESVHRDILAAWIAHHEERYLEATQAMTAAVDVGERNELVEIFVRVGPPIVDLLASLSTERPVWRQVILDRFRQVTQVTPGAGLLDPLTNRELEVLSHLPSRMSNLELAEHCFVSHNTIKSHIAHIYQKLEVTSRGEAVTRGQQLGLI
jgi:LuxR family transcriptional regulator, maltose regulon positive regulatory protein